MRRPLIIAIVAAALLGVPAPALGVGSDGQAQPESSNVDDAQGIVATPPAGRATRPKPAVPQRPRATTARRPVGTESVETSARTAVPRKPGAKTCQVPGPNAAFAKATPQSVHLDPAKLAEATDYANRHLRLSVQVFRNNCLVAEGTANRLTVDIPHNVWSSTKSVISLLTGLAQSQGRLSIEDPIGKYLPAGYGDKAHRAITIRQPLTETSGLDGAIVSEAASILIEPNIAKEPWRSPSSTSPARTSATASAPLTCSRSSFSVLSGRTSKPMPRSTSSPPWGSPATTTSGSATGQVTPTATRTYSSPPASTRSWACSFRTTESGAAGASFLLRT